MTDDPHATPKTLPAELTPEEWAQLELLARRHGLDALADKCARHARPGSGN